MSIYDYGLGYGVEEMKPEQKANNTFDGDVDASSLEALNAENSVEYLEFYSKLQEANADTKIRMLRKINASLINCKSNEKLQSIEEFISIQSLETAAQSEVAGGAHEATGDKVNKEKLTENKDNFFKTLWKRIVEAFRSIIKHIKDALKWIRDKVTAFFNKTPEVSENLPEEKKEEINKKLEEYIIPEEDLSTEGVISLKNNITDVLLGNTKKYITICTCAKALALSIQKNNRPFDGSFVSGPITKLIEVLKEMKIPNVDKLPTMQSASKDDVKKFNSALKATIADISYDKHPEHYAKVMCGADIIKKTKNITLAEFFGNNVSFDAIRFIIKKTNENLGLIDKNIDAAEKQVEEMDRAFTQYLNAGGNRSRITGEIKADGSGDDARYAVIGTVTAVFRVVQSLAGVFSKISSKIAKTVTIATKTVNIAAKDSDKAKADAAKAKAEKAKADEKAKAKQEKIDEKAKAKQEKIDEKAKAEKAKTDKAKADDDFFKNMEKDNAKKDEEEQRAKNLQKAEDAKRYQDAVDADAKARDEKAKADAKAARDKAKAESAAKKEADAKAKREADYWKALKEGGDEKEAAAKKAERDAEDEKQRKKNLSKLDDIMKNRSEAAKKATDFSHNINTVNQAWERWEEAFI